VGLSWNWNPNTCYNHMGSGPRHKAASTVISNAPATLKLLWIYCQFALFLARTFIMWSHLEIIAFLYYKKNSTRYHQPFIVECEVILCEFVYYNYYFILINTDFWPSLKGRTVLFRAPRDDLQINLRQFSCLYFLNSSITNLQWCL
jgi:hypothetical protein